MSPIILGPLTPVGNTEIVLDPVEVADARVELHLNQSAIRVAQEGIAWGDAQVEQYLAEASRGQLPVDFRIPNRQITIPLLIGASGPAGYQHARNQLLAKVALIHREGGWLRRGSGLYADIVGASLTFPDKYGSWLGIETDVVLVLDVLPDFYGDEITLTSHPETGDPSLSFLEQDILGDYPGRVRIVVRDEEGQTQLGLLCAIRSRHYSDAPTAQIANGAADLTPLDVAYIDNAQLRHDALRTTWTAVASTDTIPYGPMTHTGTSRVWVRVYTDSPTPPHVRLVWGVGDLVKPQENTPVAIPGTGDWYDIDLGEVRLDPPPVGAHRWHGQLQARGAANSDDIRFHRVWVVPVDESYTVLRAEQIPQVPAGYVARDDFTGTVATDPLNGRTAPFGGDWETSGAATDFAFTDDLGQEQIRRSTVSNVDPRYAILGSTEYDDVQVEVKIRHTSWSHLAGEMIEQGTIARWVDDDNYLRGSVVKISTGPALIRQLKLTLTVAGVPEGVWWVDVPSTVTPDQYWLVRLQVFSNGLAILGLYDETGSTLIGQVVQSIADCATGGVLEAGRPGLLDWNESSAVIQRHYDDFCVAQPPPLDAVMYPDRTVELRHDGVYRESADGSFYAPQVALGDLPRLPPSGIEERPVEVFVKGSRGDLDRLPDTGVDDISTQVFYRPSFLFPTDT